MMSGYLKLVCIWISMLFCFARTFASIFTSSNVNTTVIQSPKIFYVNKNDTGIAKVTKEVLSFGSPDNGAVSTSYEDLAYFRVKKTHEVSVDGNWGNWGEFGPPSKSCDEGFRTRRRLCNNPAPRGQGKYCEGLANETMMFVLGRCTMKNLDTEFQKYDMGPWNYLNSKTAGYYWKVKFGAGKSRLTGPQRDATGDGYYLLLDSSQRGRSPEDQAIIISEELTPAPKVNRACLKFRYYMYGSDVGLLSVKISRDSKKPKEIWSKYGDQGNQWNKGKVTLKSSVKFQVLFVGAIGEPYQSDIALDSIYIDYGPCKCQDEYQSCSSWESEGKCGDNIAYYWMARNCKTSCKTCDCRNVWHAFDHCVWWAEKGFCSRYPYIPWMSAHCQLSCRLCTCRDSLGYTECQSRLKAHECESQPMKMAETCKLSCGFCSCRNIRTDGDCHMRMSRGECDTNPLEMSSSCKYTCGFCNCIDRFTDCRFKAQQGECRSNATWMNIHCTLSCGKCGCHDNNDNCAKYKSWGGCSSHPLYMNAHCQKTCGICIDNNVPESIDITRMHIQRYDISNTRNNTYPYG